MSHLQVNKGEINNNRGRKNFFFREAKNSFDLSLDQLDRWEMKSGAGYQVILDIGGIQKQ